MVPAHQVYALRQELPQRQDKLKNLTPVASAVNIISQKDHSRGAVEKAVDEVVKLDSAGGPVNGLVSKNAKHGVY